MIPSPDTLPEVINTLRDFCTERLGKGIVMAKDTPNFIANRIGTFSFLDALRHMAELEMTVEEVDACTGPIAGRPKSATFRTADMVGVDVLAQVVRNLHEHTIGDESREIFKLPAFIEEMLRRGWLGDKAGGGFYKRERKYQRRRRDSGAGSEGDDIPAATESPFRDAGHGEDHWRYV